MEELFNIQDGGCLFVARVTWHWLSYVFWVKTIGLDVYLK